VGPTCVRHLRSQLSAIGSYLSGPAASHLKLRSEGCHSPADNVRARGPMRFERSGMRSVATPLYRAGAASHIMQSPDGRPPQAAVLDRLATETAEKLVAVRNTTSSLHVF
jgi:hypothetical protein